MPARHRSASARGKLVALLLLVAEPGCGGELESRGDDAGPGPIATASPASGEIPCGPRAIIQEVCGQCHASPPRNGAPYAIVDIADVRRLHDGEPTSAAMTALVEQRRMPLAPAKITDEQRTILLDWLRSGAPASNSTVCP